MVAFSGLMFFQLAHASSRQNHPFKVAAHRQADSLDPVLKLDRFGKSSPPPLFVNLPSHVLCF